MVGIVIVSHSRPLANALADLVRQVASPEVPIAVAAGVGEERAEFGTDAVEIMQAILSVDSPDGVLVLMDLGSAILSAEMALELLPPETAARIRFCAAPLVEGAIAAGVQAGLGMDLQTVCSEASDALLPKAEQLGAAQSQPTAAAPPPEPPAQDSLQTTLTLHTLHGLHARPAALFVQTAARFDADIRVKNLTTGKGPVSARSLNALATLAALHGHQVQVSASGPQAAQALAALEALVADNFGEHTLAPAPPAPPAAPAPAPLPAALPGALMATPVAEGVALGPLFRFQPPLPPVSAEPAQHPEQELARLNQAIESTRQAIRQRKQTIALAAGAQEAAIFDAHLLILEDPELLEQVQALIQQEHFNAAYAWKQGIDRVAAAYQALPDPYLQQRAADVQDVGSQVLFALAGKASGLEIRFPEPSILFAADLTPTETAQLDMSQVLGVITVGGGPTSHSAILARALGIPAVSGASLSLEQHRDGTLVGLDGVRGAIWIEPPPAVQSDLLQRRTAWLEERQRLLRTSRALAATRDGQRIEVVANVGSVPDARLGLQNGAEGIGLLRTEFLYLTRASAPSEDEQVQSLRLIAQEMAADGDASRPIIVRTLDIGGDKELPYLPMLPEANPFLGVRALRLSLRSPDIFRAQLRAVLRAGDGYNFRIMFPMVANLDELLEARRRLEQAHQELLAENVPHAWPIQTGIMVEIPSAALTSNILAPHVDFFSIGTNDLTQYTLAAERGNPLLAAYADGLHPAVLQLIRQVTRVAQAHGKWVGVCGELAGDALAAPILVGLGVSELSMNPAAIPRVKAVLRNTNLAEAQALADRALSTKSTAEARALAQAFAAS